MIKTLVDLIVVPKRYAHFLSPRTCDCGLIQKRGLGRWKYIKDLEIRTFQIIWVGPKLNDKSP